MDKKGVSEVISVVMLAGFVIAVGIFSWSFLSSYASLSRLEGGERLNEDMTMLRSMISADYVLWPEGLAWLRNVGTEDVVVMRLMVYDSGGRLRWSSEMGPIYREDAIGEYVLRVNEKGLYRFVCTTCDPEKPVMLNVYYIPVKLLSEATKTNPETMLFQVKSFRSEGTEWGYLGGGVAPQCYGYFQGKNWTWVDYVDPEETSIAYGSLSENIRVRFAKASEIDYIRVRVGVASLRENTVISMSGSHQVVKADTGGRTYPITLRIESVMDNWVLPQREWYFDRLSSYRTCVELIKLFWNTFNYRVYGVYTTVYHGSSGNYNITAVLKDCTGNVISRGWLVRTGVSSGSYEDYMIRIYPYPSMFDVWRVEVYVQKIS